MLKRKKSARVYQLRSLKKLGRSVERTNRSAIARQVMKDDRIRTRVIELIGTHLGKEMKKLCTKKVASVLRKANSDSVQQFSIQSIIEEMKMHASSVCSSGMSTWTQTFEGQEAEVSHHRC